LGQAGNRFDGQVTIKLSPELLVSPHPRLHSAKHRVVIEGSWFLADLSMIGC